VTPGSRLGDGALLARAHRLDVDRLQQAADVGIGVGLEPVRGLDDVGVGVVDGATFGVRYGGGILREERDVRERLPRGGEGVKSRLRPANALRGPTAAKPPRARGSGMARMDRARPVR
jgi:hypothetical protein